MSSKSVFRLIPLLPVEDELGERLQALDAAVRRTDDGEAVGRTDGGEAVEVFREDARQARESEGRKFVATRDKKHSELSFFFSRVSLISPPFSFDCGKEESPRRALELICLFLRDYRASEKKKEEVFNASFSLCASCKVGCVVGFLLSFSLSSAR